MGKRGYGDDASRIRGGYEMSQAIVLDGHSLTLEQVESVAMDLAVDIELCGEAEKRVTRSKDFIESKVLSGERVYGVTTGFGRLADVEISPDETSALQHNLVRSHASGMGSPFPREVVRAIMLLRANALARGVSGCRVDLIRALIGFLNAGVHPRVPEFGSVGASGDLAPLAHVALGLIGEGEAECDEAIGPVGHFLTGAGVEAMTLAPKEGLALINGTQATTGLGILALMRAERALATAELASAMSLEALLGTPSAYHQEIHLARPHQGQVHSAQLQRQLLAKSEIRESHRNDDPRVQDAYSLRCVPQVHGAARHALRYVRGILETEANSATDNPLVFPAEELILSGGNFHAQIISQALDLLAIALADLAAFSERRVERLLNPDLSAGLPAFLAKRPGVESGFMIAQVTAVDLLAELRLLAGPASIDSVTTSANQEDHVSMGLAAARKAYRSVRCLERVLAIELMCAAEGIEYRRPLKAGAGVEEAWSIVRSYVSRLEGDRMLGPDLETLTNAIGSGALSEVSARYDVRDDWGLGQDL